MDIFDLFGPTVADIEVNLCVLVTLHFAVIVCVYCFPTGFAFVNIVCFSFFDEILGLVVVDFVYFENQIYMCSVLVNLVQMLHLIQKI